MIFPDQRNLHAVDMVPADSQPLSPPDLFFEKRAVRRGATVVAGVDEVGRGPLAGPVVVAAVILNRRRIPDGIRDSKLLTANAREEIYEQLMTHATVSVVTAPDTDRPATGAGAFASAASEMASRRVTCAR